MYLHVDQLLLYMVSFLLILFFFCFFFLFALYSYRYGSAPTSEQVNDFRTICKLFFADHPGEIVGELIIH